MWWWQGVEVMLESWRWAVATPEVVAVAEGTRLAVEAVVVAERRTGRRRTIGWNECAVSGGGYGGGGSKVASWPQQQLAPEG